MRDLDWPEWADGMSVAAIRELHDAAVEIVEDSGLAQADLDRLAAAIQAIEADVAAQL